MTGEVLGRRANRNAALEDLQTHIRPLAYRLEIDATIDESLCEVSSPCAQRVGADCDWPRYFVRFEEFDSLDMVRSASRTRATRM